MRTSKERRVRAARRRLVAVRERTAAGRAAEPRVWTVALGATLALGAACTKSGNLEVGALGLDSIASMECVPPASDDARDVACSRWACGHSELAAAPWNGDEASCDPGSVDEHARDRALRVVNAYRFLAGVPELSVETRWEAPAQDCALLAHANRRLSHSPPPEWSCWSDRGARASAVSLVANRSAPQAVDPFIEDAGNESTMVHRRWLLSEKIRRVGFGSTSRFTCALVDGREWDDASAEPPAEPALPAWVAWPPPGPVPMDVFRRTKLDAIGWTIQSSSLDLDGAVVTVRAAGEPRAVTVSPLERTMGSLTAVRFVPDGWAAQAGSRYDVQVEKGGAVIAYAVEPVDCP
ncbi:MAG: CAP domain-containing protein [Labilithrix sp.]|nr:CAP domain-containing protein [Labilithrix sp.]